MATRDPEVTLEECGLNGHRGEDKYSRHYYTDFSEEAGWWWGEGGGIGSKHARPTICTVSSQSGDFGR